MVLKNNNLQKLEKAADRRQHFGIRKLTIGAASVLLGTTLWLGRDAINVEAADQANDSKNSNDADQATESKVETPKIDDKTQVEIEAQPAIGQIRTPSKGTISASSSQTNASIKADVGTQENIEQKQNNTTNAANEKTESPKNTQLTSSERANAALNKAAAINKKTANAKQAGKFVADAAAQEVQHAVSGNSQNDSHVQKVDLNKLDLSQGANYAGLSTDSNLGAQEFLANLLATKQNSSNKDAVAQSNTTDSKNVDSNGDSGSLISGADSAANSGKNADNSETKQVVVEKADQDKTVDTLSQGDAALKKTAAIINAGTEAGYQSFTLGKQSFVTPNELNQLGVSLATYPNGGGDLSKTTDGLWQYKAKDGVTFTDDSQYPLKGNSVLENIIKQDKYVFWKGNFSAFPDTYLLLATDRDYSSSDKSKAGQNIYWYYVNNKTNNIVNHGQFVDTSSNNITNAPVIGNGVHEKNLFYYKDPSNTSTGKSGASLSPAIAGTQGNDILVSYGSGHQSSTTSSTDVGDNYGTYTSSTTDINVIYVDENGTQLKVARKTDKNGNPVIVLDKNGTDKITDYGMDREHYNVHAIDHPTLDGYTPIGVMGSDGITYNDHSKISAAAWSIWGKYAGNGDPNTLTGENGILDARKTGFTYVTGDSGQDLFVHHVKNDDGDENVDLYQFNNGTNTYPSQPTQTKFFKAQMATYKNPFGSKIGGSMTIPPAHPHDIVVVFYKKATSEKQTAKVSFVDDDENQAEISGYSSLTASGDSKSAISFTDNSGKALSDIVQDIINQNYVYKGTTGTGVTGGDTTKFSDVVLPAFDNDSTKEQDFTIHFKHKINESTITKKVDLKVTYQNEDGSDAGVTAPDNATNQTLTFSGTAKKDAVTGNYLNADGTQGNASTPVYTWTVSGGTTNDQNKGTFATVTTPTKEGYTVKSVMEGSTSVDDGSGNVKAILVPNPSSSDSDEQTVNVVVTYQKKSAPVVGNYKEITVTRTLVRNIDYKINSNKAIDYDPSGLTDMDLSKLSTPHTETQTVTLEGVGVIDTTTGQLVAFDHTFDSNGNVVVTPGQNGDAFVVEKDSSGKAKQGQFYWRLPNGSKFAGFDNPTADGFTSETGYNKNGKMSPVADPSKVPEVDVTKDTEVNVYDSKGNLVSTPTVGELLNQWNKDTVNEPIDSITTTEPTYRPNIIPSDQYIFDQYQVTDSNSNGHRNYDYIITLTTKKNDPTGTVYVYATNPENGYTFQNGDPVYVNSSISDPLSFGNQYSLIENNGKFYPASFTINVRNFGGDYGNSVAVNISTSKNDRGANSFTLMRLFGYGAQFTGNDDYSDSWGDYKPRYVQQMISFVDTDGNEIDGYPAIKTNGNTLVGQHYDFSNFQAPEIPGYELISEPAKTGSISDYQVGQTYTRTWFTQVDGYNYEIIEHHKLIDNQGTMDTSVTVNTYNSNGDLLNTEQAEGTIQDGESMVGPESFVIQNPYVPQTTDLEYVYKKVNTSLKENPVFVVYTPGNTVASMTVKYEDEDDNDRILQADPISGSIGNSINYSTDQSIQNFEKQGYVLDQDNYPFKATDKFTDANNGQTYTVLLKHRAIQVTPNTPSSDLPKNTPDDAQPQNLKVTVTRNISYKLDNGSGNPATMSDMTGIPNTAVKQQTVTFTGTTFVDAVTGHKVHAVTGKDSQGKDIYVVDNSDTTPVKISWSADNNGKFASVVAPNVAGYTHSPQTIAEERVVRPSESYTEPTIYVVYTPNAVQDTVKYIDDTTNETLRTDSGATFDTLKGQPNDAVTYTTSGIIQDYENQGYILASTQPKPFTDGQMKFGTAGQTYEVHFIHKIDNIDKDNPHGQTVTKSVTRKVYYTVDGVPATDTNLQDQTETATFDATGHYDEVAKQVVDLETGTTADQGKVQLNSDDSIKEGTLTWTAEGGTSDSANLAGYDAPTKTGYHVNNITVDPAADKADNVIDAGQTNAGQVKGINVNHNSHDVTIYINLTKNPVANPQAAKITVIDEDNHTANKQLASAQISGKAGSAISFDTMSSTVQNYISNGYVWDYANEGTTKLSATNYAGINFGKFDSDDNTTQNWTIYLRHRTTHVDHDHPGNGYSADDLQKTVTTKISYVDEKGNEISGLDPVSHTVTFNGQGDYDNVTKQWVKVDTNNKIIGPAPGLTWTFTVDKKPAQSGNSTTLDALGAQNPSGYTYAYTNGSWDSKLGVHTTDGSVAQQTVTPSTADSNIIVHFNKIPTARANIVITYHDDTTNTDLKTDTGKPQDVGSNITYSTQPSIDDYEKQGYKLVSNVTIPSTMPATGFTGIVHLVHDTETKTETDTATAHVHYEVLGNDSDKPSAPEDSATQTVTWSRTDTVDKVTGKVTEGSWNQDKSSFSDVTSPTVTGYTPSQTSVSFATPVQGEDQVVTVVYTKKAPAIDTASIKVVDEDDNDAVLAHNAIQGADGTTIGFDGMSDTVKYYLNHNYNWDGVSQGNSTTKLTGIDGYSHIQFGNFDKNNKNQSWTIYLKHATDTVDHNHPGNGYTADQLQKTVTTDIKYVDDSNNGAEMTGMPEIKETVTFNGLGTYDKVTGNWVTVGTDGKLTQVSGPTWNYSVTGVSGMTDGDGQSITLPAIGAKTVPTSYTYSYTNGSWDSNLGVDTTNGTVAQQTVTRSTADSNIVVHFNKKPAEVTYHTEDDTREVTRIINYLDSEDHSKSLATQVTQTAELSRKEILDNKGNVIGYGTVSTDGKSYTLSDDYTVTSNGWIAVDSPDETAKGYKKIPHFDDGSDASTVSAGTVNSSTPTPTTINVYYDHDTVVVPPTNPGHGLTATDLNKTVTRIIKYQDNNGTAVNGSPDGKSTYAQTATFTRTAIVDKTNDRLLGYDTNGDGKVDVLPAAGDYAWTATNNSNQFASVASKDPSDVGYNHVDIQNVSAITVGPNSDSSTVTVTYSKDAQQGSFQIHYIDEDDNNAVLHSDSESGKYGDPVSYDPSTETKTLTDQGYVEDTTYNKANKYITQSSINQNNNGKIFIIAFKHDTKQGTTETNVPTETIHFRYADGTTAAPDVQGSAGNFKFTRTPTLDAVTGHVIDPGTWNKENYTFNDGSKNVKVINGYVADKATYGNKTATPTDKDVEDVVIYRKISNIIPVDQNGNQIPGTTPVNYTNDPNDPTKVTPNETSPSVPNGWKISTTGQPSGVTPNTTNNTATVTPADPTKLTKVVYTEDSEKATLHIIDINDSNKELNQVHASGQDNSSITFNNARTTIDDWLNKGYKVNSIEQATADPKKPISYANDYAKASATWTFDDKPGVDQEFYVYLEHDYAPINPENPHGRTDLTRQVKETVHYVDEATNRPVVSDYTDTLTFTGQGMVDEVTHKMLAIKSVVNGQITYDNDLSKEIDISKAKDTDFVWSNPSSFAKVTSPTIAGYTIDADKTDQNSLAANGNIQEIDNIGYDHSSVEATVYYKANPVHTQEAATLTIIDDTTGGQLADYSVIGQDGAAITFKDTQGKTANSQITDYLSDGYDWEKSSDNGLTAISYNTFDYGKLDNDPKTKQSWTIYLVHETKQLTPNDKYGNESLDKKITRNVKYQYDDGTQAANSVNQTVEFNGQGYTDQVTGQLVQDDGHGHVKKNADGSIVPGQITWKLVKQGGQAVTDGTDSAKFDQIGKPTVDQNASIVKITSSGDVTYSVNNDGSVDAQNLTHQNNDSNVVIVYHKGAVAEHHTAELTIYANDKQVGTATATGDKGTDISFANAGSIVQAFEDNGYTFDHAEDVSNNKQITGTNYNDIQFGKYLTSNNSDQRFAIYLTKASVENSGLKIVDDTENRTLANYGQSGKTGETIKFADGVAQLKYYLDNGYDWSKADKDGTILTDLTKGNYSTYDFGKYQDNENPVWTIHLVHQIVPVDHNHPGNGYGSDQLTKTITTKVSYVDQDGKAIGIDPVDNTVTFNGSGYYDAVTKQWTDKDGKVLTDQNKGISWTNTSSTPNGDSVIFNKIDAQHPAGYTYAGITVNADPGLTVNKQDGSIAVQTVTPNSANSTVVIRFNKNITKQGTIEVIYHDNTSNVDLTGYGQTTTKQDEGTSFTYNPNAKDLPTLEKLHYVVDGQLPTMPTKYTDGDQRIVIYVKHGTKNDHVSKTVTRDFIYVFSDGTRATAHTTTDGQPVSEAAQTVTFNGHKIIDLVTGKTVSVDKDGKINGLGGPVWDENSAELPYVSAKEVKGYHVVSTRNAHLDGSAGEVTVTPDSDDIHVRITYAPDEHNAETVVGKQTVHYVDGDDNNAKLLDDNVNSTFTFTKDGKTGQWNSNSYKYDDANAPVISGYVAEQKTYTGQTATPTDPNKEITIIYHKISKIIPVDKSGNQIPKQSTPTYVNDPKDPTKVVSNQPTPNIPGWHITNNPNPGKTPDGKTDIHTVTPVDPTKPTKVTYEQNGTTLKNKKTVTASQKVEYQDDKGNTLSPTKTQNFTFTYSGDTCDAYTGDLIKKGTWDFASHNFGSENVPNIPGYTLTSGYSKNGNSYTAGGFATDPNASDKDRNRTFIVVYTKTPGKPVATTGNITYYDDSEGGRSLESASFNGDAGDKINYTTADRISYYEGIGYDLVSNNFADGKQTFDKVATKNVFAVHLKHAIVPVTPQNPGKPGESVPKDPKNPNEPDHKYPDNYQPQTLTRDVTRTVSYVFTDGKRSLPDVKKIIKFTGQGILDLVTGHLVTVNGNHIEQNGSIQWSPSTAQFDPTKAIDMTGYYISGVKNTNSQATVDSNTGAVSGETVTPTSNNIDIVITLKPNPVTPPTHTTQTATLTIHDATANTDLGHATVQGPDGGDIDFGQSSTDQISYYLAHGYKWQNATYNGADLKVDGIDKISFGTFDKNDDSKGASQAWVINLVHQINHVDHKNPGNGYSSNQLTKTITTDVSYVDEHGKAIADITPVHNSVTFNGSGYYDAVTKQWTDKDGKVLTDQSKGITWTNNSSMPNSDSATFAKINAQKPNGYTYAGFTGTKDPNLIINDQDGSIDAQIVTPTSADSDIVIHFRQNQKPVVKNQNAGLRIIDQDNNNTVLNTYNGAGKAADSINFNGYSSEVINNYIKQGYIVVGLTNDNNSAIDAAMNGTDPTKWNFGKYDDKDDITQNFTITLKHGTEDITPNNPDPDRGYTKDSLTRTGTQTVHYIIAGSEADKPAAPADHTAEVNFTHSLTIDKVTGKVIKDNGWTPASQTYAKIDTPAVNGYDPDKKSIQAKTVTIDPKTGKGNIDDYEVVVYTKTPAVPNKAAGTVIYIDDTAQKTLVSDNLSGQVGSQIDYTTAGKIADYEKQGYKLVSNNFRDGQEVFAKTGNNFAVHLIHTFIPINPKTTDKHGVDPDTLEKTVTETVHYEGAGKQTPKDNVQTSKWSKQVTYDEVTGKVVTNGQYDTDWSIEPGQKTVYDQVNTPNVPGYQPDQNNVPAAEVTQNNITKTVTYSKNPAAQARIVITYHDDTTNKDLKTDTEPNQDVGTNITYSTHPSISDFEKQGYRLVSDVMIPTIMPQNGFTGIVHLAHTYSPVDPNHPHDDINPSQYQKDVTATVHYVYSDGTKAHDDNVQKATWTRALTIDNVTGQIVPNGKDDKPWTANKKSYDAVSSPTIAGYHPDKEIVPVKTVTQDNLEETVIYVKNGTVLKNQQAVTASQTVEYQDDQGHALSPSKKLNFTFTYTGNTYDANTGKLISKGNWNAENHSFTAENVPVIDGYVAVSGFVKNRDSYNAGGFATDHDASDAQRNRTFVVIYKKISSIVPITPDHKPIPNPDKPGSNVPSKPYINDPKDPTKVVNESVPTIPGYMPNTPTVTPADPTKPTEVTYTKNPVIETGTVTITVHDNTTGKDLSQYGYSSDKDGKPQKVGTKIDYNKQQTITDLINHGYKVINPDVSIPTSVTKGNTPVVIYVEHTTTTVTPDKPGTPGQPVDPSNPNGPKYPTGTDLSQLKKTATQTIHYTGAGKQTPADNTQSFTFTRQITFDNVTGKIINTTPWNVSSHTFDSVTTPVVNGYHADKGVINGSTVTPDDLTKTVTVAYNANGHIIPVDLNGNPIPGADQPVLPTDPKDPTKVVNGQVPAVPGYQPVNGKPGDPVSPNAANPGLDVKVPYKQKSQPTLPVNPTNPPQPTAASSQPSKASQPTSAPTAPTKPIPDEPDEPVGPDTPDEPDHPATSHRVHRSTGNKTSRPQGYSYNNMPHGEYSNGYNYNNQPLGQTLPNGDTVLPNGEVVDANGNVVGYMDESGHIHYNESDKSVLPQTGESSSENIAAAIAGGLAVSIGLIGLAGVRKKRRD